MKKNSLRTILIIVFVALCAFNLVACGLSSSSETNGTYYFYDPDHDAADENIKIVIRNGKATVYGLIAENMSVKVKNKTITMTTTNSAENTKNVLSGKILTDGAIYFNSSATYSGSQLIDEDAEDLWFCKRNKTPYDFDEFNQSGGGDKDNDNDDNPSGTITGTGYNVGDIAPDFTLSTYNYSSKFNLYKSRGNITVINFWATWCTPCVAEIPLFNELAENYPEITVVAVHGLSTTDVQSFIEKHDWIKSPVIFAQDDVDGASCKTYKAFGGDDAWPLTVIVDSDSKVLYRVNRSFESYEQLEKLVKSFIDDNDNDN